MRAESVQDALAALAAADPSPNATALALREAFPSPPGWQATGAIPFASVRKWSAVEFVEHGSWFLGAPDVLLPIAHAAEADLDARVTARVEEQAKVGRRVVLLACSPQPLNGDGPPTDLTPKALVLLEDKIRTDAADTLAYFAEQGVTVKVISGDHPATVGAVARRCGIPEDDPVDARTLPEDPGRLGVALEASTVFGRVTPHQKREMVKALQARGHIVAMTGDGVNDVLALKDSDIGIAMGSGSSATRAVAQLVLLDNKFSTLAQCGRRGPSGHQQPRTSREPVRDQDGVLDDDRDRGRRHRRAVPVLAAPPHARRRADDRHPVVLPRARAERPSEQDGVRETRARLRDPRGHHRRSRDVHRIRASRASRRASRSSRPAPPRQSSSWAWVS